VKDPGFFKAVEKQSETLFQSQPKVNLRQNYNFSDGNVLVRSSTNLAGIQTSDKEPNLVYSRYYLTKLRLVRPIVGWSDQFIIGILNFKVNRRLKIYRSKVYLRTIYQIKIAVRILIFLFKNNNFG